VVRRFETLPLYEYRCGRCGTFERVQKFSDPILSKCPTCGGAVEKLLSAPAIQFKGSGWYVTDYARKSPGKEGAGKDGAGKEGAGKEGGREGGEAKDSGTGKDNAASKETSGAKESSSSATKTSDKT
jgi:putative FmdB family regulatory protein